MPVMGAGHHLSKVVAHKLDRSGTGTPHVAVLFENGAGERVTWYGYLTDNALERTIASLRILGWDPTLYDGRIDSLNETDVLVGHEAEIVVEIETYDGKSQAKVKWVNKVGGGLAPGMEKDEATSFAATLRQKILSVQPPKPSSRPGPARQPAGAGAGGGDVEGDDGLPF